MVQEQDFLELRRMDNLIVFDCGDAELWLDRDGAITVLSVLKSRKENNHNRTRVKGVRGGVDLEIAERKSYFEMSFRIDRLDSIEMKQYMLDKEKASRFAKGLASAIGSI